MDVNTVNDYLVDSDNQTPNFHNTVAEANNYFVPAFFREMDFQDTPTTEPQPTTTVVSKDTATTATAASGFKTVRYKRQRYKPLSDWKQSTVEITFEAPIKVSNRFAAITPPEQMTNLTQMMGAKRKRPTDQQDEDDSSSDQPSTQQNLPQGPESKQGKPKRKQKPTPIIVTEKRVNLLSIKSLVKDVAKKPTLIKFLSDGNLKIFTECDNDRSNIMANLDHKNVDFFTFTPKHEITKKIVMKTAPLFTAEEAKELINFKYPHVKSVVKMTSKKNPNSSKSYLVELNKSADLGVLKEAVTSIDGCIVTWQKYTKIGATQCYNCQTFGHGSSNCYMQTVCVKCGQNHPSDQCSSKQIEQNALKCANCKGNHAANYRGCPKYPKQTPPPPPPQIHYSRPANPNLTYSQATRRPEAQEPLFSTRSDNNASDFAELMSEISSLKQKIDIKKLLQDAKKLNQSLRENPNANPLTL